MNVWHKQAHLRGHVCSKIGFIWLLHFNIWELFISTTIVVERKSLWRPRAGEDVVGRNDVRSANDSSVVCLGSLISTIKNARSNKYQIVSRSLDRKKIGSNAFPLINTQCSISRLANPIDHTYACSFSHGFSIDAISVISFCFVLICDQDERYDKSASTTALYIAVWTKK